MNKIKVTHLDNKGNAIGDSFVADLEVYKRVNKNTGFDWSKAITCFVNGESYTTTNMPYGNIKLQLNK